MLWEFEEECNSDQNHLFEATDRKPDFVGRASD